MSDCICGHPKELHHGSTGCDFDWGDLDGDIGENPCPCIEYRECLPWPNADGYWWDSDGAIVEVLEGKESPSGVWVYEGDTLYTTITEWNERHTTLPARFVKLNEQSPFNPPTD